MFETMTGAGAMKVYAYLMIGAAALTLLYTVAMQAIAIYKASRHWVSAYELEEYEQLRNDRETQREARRMAGLEPDAEVILYRDLVTSWKQDRAELSTARLCLDVTRSRSRRLEAEVERQAEELSRAWDIKERLERELLESEQGFQPQADPFHVAHGTCAPGEAWDEATGDGGFVEWA